uniref:Uncharacterized protein n=1 Tax=Rhizophora mucronata TaxID=61149 RepID=A0A2P2Q1Y0_RHIMU
MDVANHVLETNSPIVIYTEIVSYDPRNL